MTAFLARLLLILFALPSFAASAIPSITHGYDAQTRHVDTGYDVRLLSTIDYDSAAVPIANGEDNQTPGASECSANFTELLAAEGEVGAGQTLYRGVWDDHPAFQEALEGSADPRGGSATALEHNMGDTRSVYTSWTTDPALAAERAGPGGVVLQQTFPAFRLVTSPDLFGEGEVLVTGPVRGASVTPIPKP